MLILSVGKGFINKYARGHIFLFVKLTAHSKDTYLVSNETFLCFINKYACGHLFVFVKLTAKSKNTHLVSNETFSKYTTKYRALYKKQLQPLFNISSESIPVDTHYYDQVWAIALAINNYLSELNNRNLSIDNYTIGQPLINAVIEEQMKNLRFQGASGWIEFNQYRSVSTPIEMFWISDNETEGYQGYQSLPQLAHVCWMLPVLCCCYSTHYIWEFFLPPRTFTAMANAHFVFIKSK